MAAAASMKTALIVSMLVIIFVAIIVAFQQQPGSQMVQVPPKTKQITHGQILTGPDVKADGPYASVEGFCGLGTCGIGPML